MFEGSELYRASAADLSLTMDDTERAAWLAERCGKLTASRMKDAVSFKKDGKPMQCRSDYQRDLLAERLTGYSARHFVSAAMEWGLATEEHAKDAYMAKTGQVIRRSGFYDHPQIDMCGATPDGEVGRDGLLEVKCPTTGVFVDWYLAGVVPEEHKPQMLLQCACTGKKWVDFVAFDPRVKDKAKQLLLRRFTPTEEEITKIEEQAQQFLDEVQALWEAFHS